MTIQEVLLIFIFGSTFGWLLEILVNRITDKKLINPGFLRGPYLPVYGFGAVLILFVSYLKIDLLMKMILFLIFTTITEFSTGIVLLKKQIRLWDYSEKKMHYKGLISFSVSLFWLVLALLFYFFIFPNFSNIAFSLWDKTIIKFLAFIWYMIVFIDFRIAIKESQLITFLNFSKFQKLFQH